MTFKVRNVTAAMLVLLSGSTLVAQSQDGSDQRAVEKQAVSQPSDAATMDTRTPHLVPSEWIIGMKVLDRDRTKRLGTVKDLVLDADDGRVVYALVNRTPRGEAAPAIVAVPWLAFTWDGTERILTLPVSRDRLAEASTFETKRWDLLDDPTWVEETYGYFKVDRDAYEHGWQDAGDDEARNPADPGQPERDRIAGDQAARDRAAADREARERADHNNAGDKATAKPKQYVLASHVEGQTLRGAEDKTIGDVDALVLDADSGRMAFIVAEFGGFLGIGDSKVAVPWDYFKVNDEGHLYTNQVKADEVRTAPRLEKADWSELRDPEFGPSVYQHFGRDPGWFKSGFDRPKLDKNGDETPDDGRRSDNR